MAVLDMESIENKIVKEMSVYKDKQIVGYSFLTPKKLKPTSQSTYFSKHLHGIS